MMSGTGKNSYLKFVVLSGLGPQLNISPRMGEAGSALQKHMFEGLL